MLYILPPPRTPPPPSPWVSILCGNEKSGSSEKILCSTWGNESEKKPPRPRIREDHIDSLRTSQDDMDTAKHPKSLSECYFAGKGTALVLPVVEAQKSNRRTDHAHGTNIRKHLQSIVDLLRPEETLKMAVKLESAHPHRIRYLVIVSRSGDRGEESCLLGIDCNDQTTVGLVLRVMADTRISLDGDGGFSVSVCGRHHIFKPVSVQAMWSALQTLHRVSSKARDHNYFQGGLSHTWTVYYEARIASDRSCLNEWHAMDQLESRRPPSPDSIRHKPRQREETEKVIRATLKEIMMSVDLDEVTSKYIRSRLEEDLDMDLGEYKSFIDQEMLTILGQMDAPTEIFDHVYLGSEWNASNYEELQKNGVGHILNVTREIDNFFPGTFDYLNIRVYDDEKTDLLKHWDDTFKYITKARKNGSKVLVHCKMGVSRSASVVIAYAMKAYNWDFKTALEHVREKRNCIKPNSAFLSQLETYQGILDAMKNREKLQRSKSETNLKLGQKRAKILANSEPTPIIQVSLRKQQQMARSPCAANRPKSWSPENGDAAICEDRNSPIFLSLEDLSQKSESVVKRSSQRHVLMPCDNGESYSVSPNQIFHLRTRESLRVKERIVELENGVTPKRSAWDPGEHLLQTAVEHVVRDPFSNQCDRVFDREEKKQRHSIGVISESVPSRQNSWSSYDSAVVLTQNDAALSRQSSWGSGDTRALPSRNSSWGSYDIKSEGTVKRAKPVQAVNRQLLETVATCPSAISPCIKIPSVITSKSLSCSAPENCTFDFVLPQKVLSKSSHNICAKEPEKRSLVQSLRQEFEAKTGETKAVNAEMNFKNLLGFFEKNPTSNKRGFGVKNRFSCIETKREQQELKRPPISPGGKTSAAPPYFTVIAKAVKKQQQYGRSHPLALLTMKSRQNNTLYNTM